MIIDRINGRNIKLGIIADDFTGATDIAGFLAENGMRTIQLNGIPDNESNRDAEALVISLKSRSCPVDMAVSLSLKALDWLRQEGCTHYYFKYCSTFDSTSRGNIGPVTDALLEALGEDITIICPALPINGRTVYKGYLFALDTLLSESGMKDHPVTPMTDSNLNRLIEIQGSGLSGNIYLETILQGEDAVRQRLDELKQIGCRYVVTDTVSDDNLEILSRAVRDFKLVTGGSGLAIGIVRDRIGVNVDTEEAQKRGKPAKGKTVILSGSCSAATNRQVEVYKTIAPSIFMDAGECLNNPSYSEELFKWTMDNFDGTLAPLIYATKTPEELAKSRELYGNERTGEAIEAVMGDLAKRLQAEKVMNFITAGGETSGMIVQALGVDEFYIGPQIAPGVSWIKALDSDVCFALKSGNFGDEKFFEKAQEFIND